MLSLGIEAKDFRSGVFAKIGFRIWGAGLRVGTRDSLEVGRTQDPGM